MSEALIIWGGWEGHRPQAFAERCAEMLGDAGLSVRVSDTLAALTELDGERLIVPIWTMGTIDPEPLAALLRAVEGGVGVAGFHGGMGDAFRDATDYQFMVGGQFVAHPDGIKDYEVTIVDRSSPITDGLADFSVRSEQYYMHVDPSNHVLATTTFAPESAPWVAGTVMPVAWTRRWGAGRVFYSSLGHAPAELDVPEARELLRRGMLWAAQSEVVTGPERSRSRS
jgi:type 1 glutamine amidotransferase